MLRSMYSGISGLKAQQTKLDVVGNNVANASTTSFKSQRIRFQDSLSQSMAYATGGTVNTGGTNPKQVGLGVQIGGIYTNTATGNMQVTGRNLDCAIDGSGYFVVGKGEIDKGIELVGGAGGVKDQIGNTNGTELVFTRDGSFSLDSEGNLLTTDGLRVYGYSASKHSSLKFNNGKGEITLGAANDLKAKNEFEDQPLTALVIPDKVKDAGGKEIRVQSFSIGKDGIISASLVDGQVAEVGQIAMASFKNDGGLQKLGNNHYQVSANSGDAVIRSRKGEDPVKDNSKGYGDCLQGKLEMSNVDLAEEFTEMIIASRAFQACGKMITTGDEILQDLVNLKR